MTQWSELGIISENLVTYLFGSYLMLAIVITLAFMLVLLAVGSELKYALPMSLPVLALFGASGWFGGSALFSGILIAAGIIYAFSMIKIVGGR